MRSLARQGGCVENLKGSLQLVSFALDEPERVMFTCRRLIHVMSSLQLQLWNVISVSDARHGICTMASFEARRRVRRLFNTTRANLSRIMRLQR